MKAYLRYGAMVAENRLEGWVLAKNGAKRSEVKTRYKLVPTKQVRCRSRIAAISGEVAEEPAVIGGSSQGHRRGATNDDEEDLATLAICLSYQRSAVK